MTIGPATVIASVIVLSAGCELVRWRYVMPARF